MKQSSTRLKRISRDAGIELLVCAAVILGLSFLLVQATIWNGTKSTENEPFFSTLPDVDMSGLVPAQADRVLERLNVQRCPCDCKRTVASCRNQHRSCSLSLARARESVAAAKKQ
jgi:hypothetical protein